MPEAPDLETWTQSVRDTLASCGPRTHLIGHSFGGTVALKLAAELTRLEKVHVVAAPFWAGVDKDWYVPAYALSNPEIAQLRTKHLFFYHGTKDDIVPFPHLSEFQAIFPDAVFRSYTGMNHIDPSDNFLSDLAADCLST